MENFLAFMRLLCAFFKVFGEECFYSPNKFIIAKDSQITILFSGKNSTFSNQGVFSANFRVSMILGFNSVSSLCPAKKHLCNITFFESKQRNSASLKFV